MSQTLIKFTPYLGRACSQCGTTIEHHNICPNCRTPVGINMDLMGYKNMINSTFLNVESRQNRIIQTVQQGFKPGSTDLKKYLSMKTLEILLVQINENLLISIENECKEFMRRFNSFEQQGKQLLGFLEETSKNLSIQIQKVQKNLKNPIKIAFQEYNTSFSHLSVLSNKLKRFENRGVKKSLLDRFTVDKKQTNNLALKIRELSDGLKNTVQLQEMFQKLNTQLQKEMENINFEYIQTSDIQLLAESECKLLEFQTLFKVRDTLCKEPWESNWKLFFRKAFRFLSKVWELVKILFAGGGIE